MELDLRMAELDRDRELLSFFLGVFSSVMALPAWPII